MNRLWKYGERRIGIWSREADILPLLLVALLAVFAATPRSARAVETPSLVVTTTSDIANDTDNQISLREAVAYANGHAGADVVTFAAAGFSSAQTITLTLGRIDINSDVTIDGPDGAARVTISGNNVGRIFKIVSGTVGLKDLALTGGRSTGSGSDGGAIFNAGALTISNSTLSGNFTDIYGGAIYNDFAGTLTVNNSTLSGNSAANSGGAIYNNNVTTVTNSTLFGNSAPNGSAGAIFNSTTLTINNSTLAGNTAKYAGALYNQESQGSGSSGEVTLNNSIVGGNSADVAGNDIYGSVSGGDYNLVQSTGSATLSGTHNVTGLAPQVEPLKNNGGPTQTLALLAGSPAINAGDPAFSGTGKTDQRGAGFPRVVNGRLDIGAYEWRQPSQTGSSLVVNSTADNGDGTCDVAGTGDGCTLREAVANADSNDGAATITFAPSVFNSAKTITLTNGEIAINSDVTIDGPDDAAHVTISGNNAGRIFNVLSGTVLLRDFTFTGGSSVDGGGAILNSGTLTVSNSTLTGNSSRFAGGAIYNEVGGTLTVNSSTLSGNSADGDGGTTGGAIFNSNVSTATVNNSTLSGNHAAYNGGAIYNGGAMAVNSSTLVGNSVEFDDGGGIDNADSLTLNNSIVANNISPKFGPDIRSETTGGDYNLLTIAEYANLSGTHNITADPNLGPLQNNGGPTQTMALLAGSPAINKANAAPATDQRGYDRVGAPDIGAFEFGGAPRDTSNPVVELKIPGNNTAVKSLPAISGTASDVGSGIQRVDVYLRRNVNGVYQYWTGTAWSTAITLLTTTLTTTSTGVSWTRNSSLPTGTNLPAGTYTTFAYSYDKVGNRSQTSTSPNSLSTFTVDVTVPVVELKIPGNNTAVKSLPAISGTASDVGSGIQRVDVYLRRNVNGVYQYWTGTAWSTAITLLTTTLTTTSTGVSWTRNSSLPTGTNLPAGTYTTFAYSYDKVGNRSQTSTSPNSLSTFTVTAP